MSNDVEEDVKQVAKAGPLGVLTVTIIILMAALIAVLGFWWLFTG
jgi:hypothetical protein